MAQRMLLIPQESLQRLHGDKTDMSALDKAMSHILQKKKLSDVEKWKEYKQALQRYLHVTQRHRKGVNLAMQEIQKPESHDSLRGMLVGTIPKRLQPKAMFLFDALSMSSSITWNKDGHVSIKGQPVLGSHIVELINDVLRQRKNSNPTGWEAFAKLLKELELEKFVLNPDRIAFLNQSGSGFKWDHFKFRK